VLNRANGRLLLFRKETDYVAFERVMEESHAREPLRIPTYSVLARVSECLLPQTAQASCQK
jgi:hypothetical protein